MNIIKEITGVLKLGKFKQNIQSIICTQLAYRNSFRLL